MTMIGQIQAVRHELCKHGGTKCSTCGYKIRGPRHADGDHHKKIRKAVAQ